ncbi:hypothetical protein [Xanthomonas vasicola]|nr:hypothetical protein [Xanthomonas vasicola]MDO6961214.1 hypothetical protein [Xanthomonas vasicola]
MAAHFAGLQHRQSIACHGSVLVGHFDADHLKALQLRSDQCV